MQYKYMTSMTEPVKILGSRKTEHMVVNPPI